MTPAIETRALTVRYGDTAALDELTIRLAGGRIHGLLGRNGAGKTTLLSVLAGFRRPTAGEVLVDGRAVFEDADVAARVCFIGESGVLCEQGERVAEVLSVARRLRQGFDADYADKLVERFAVPRRTKVGELSRGQRSALGIVVGLASRADLTMFDESHLGMDVPGRVAFQEELLADMIAHPRTVIVSTHLIEEMSTLFEDVVIIDRGRTALYDEADRLRSRGAEVVGPAEVVDRFTTGMRVVGERRLGPTKAATVYGGLGDDRRREAAALGLDVGPVPLQDLFVHLTAPQEDTSVG